MKTKYRIGQITMWLMLGVALFIDVIEFLLTAIGIGVVVDWLTWVVSWLIFPIWFIIKGASYSRNKKLFRGTLLGMLIGLVPVLNALPELTATIWFNIVAVREEDREEEKRSLVIASTKKERWQRKSKNLSTNHI